MFVFFPTKFLGFQIFANQLSDSPDNASVSGGDTGKYLLDRPHRHRQNNANVSTLKTPCADKSPNLRVVFA